MPARSRVEVNLDDARAVELQICIPGLRKLALVCPSWKINRLSPVTFEVSNISHIDKYVTPQGSGRVLDESMSRAQAAGPKRPIGNLPWLTRLAS